MNFYCKLLNCVFSERESPKFKNFYEQYPQLGSTLDDPSAGIKRCLVFWIFNACYILTSIISYFKIKAHNHQTDAEAKPGQPQTSNMGNFAAIVYGF